MFSLIFDILFPKKCVGCGSFGSYLCRSCIKNSFQKELICPICSRSAVGGQTHPICKRRYNLDGLWSLGSYQGALRQAILQFKYHQVSDISKDLANIIIEYWARNTPFLLEEIRKDPDNWFITSVPLHWFRQNKRGFNQSELMARDIAGMIGIPYKDLLKRVHSTKQQVKLNAHDRRFNTKGAFVAQNIPKNSNVLLFDDVFTTGSTMKECCFVLKKMGAKIVWGVTLAR